MPSAKVTSYFKLQKTYDRVFITLDNDLNQTGQRGAKKLKNLLSRDGHQVYNMTVPRIASNRESFDWPEILEQRGHDEAQKLFESSKREAISIFEKERSIKSSGSLETSVAREIIEIVNEQFGSNSIIFNKSVFLLKNAKECFEIKTDKQISVLVTKLLQKYNIKDVEITVKFVNNVILNLKGLLLKTRELPFIEGYKGSMEDVIFLKDIAIKIHKDKVEILNFDLEYQFTQSRLAAKYDPTKESVTYVKMVDQIFEGDENKIRAFQEIFGFCLIQSYPLHKFLVLYGKGRNGKGALCAGIKALVPNYTSLSLWDLNVKNNKFKSAKLYGSKVNFANDDNFLNSDVEFLKTLTSGEEITTEMKNQDSFQFKNSTKIIISTNIFPTAKDHSNALWDRMLFIPINFEVRDEKDQNSDFSNSDWWKSQDNEMSGILNWAIGGLQRLLKNGKFTVIPESKEMKKEMRELSHPIGEFLHSKYQETDDKQSILFTDDMFQKYLTWCESGKYTPLNKSHFGRFIKDTFRGIKGARKRKKNGFEKLNCWIGLSEKTDEEPLEIKAKPVQTDYTMNFAPSTKPVKEQERYEMPI